jgi:hypothetical protein
VRPGPAARLEVNGEDGRPVREGAGEGLDLRLALEVGEQLGLPFPFGVVHTLELHGDRSFALTQQAPRFSRSPEDHAVPP